MPSGMRAFLTVAKYGRCGETFPRTRLTIRSSSEPSTRKLKWVYDSNGAKSNAKGRRLVSLAVSGRLRGGPHPSRSGTSRRG